MPHATLYFLSRDKTKALFNSREILYNEGDCLDKETKAYMDLILEEFLTTKTVHANCF